MKLKANRLITFLTLLVGSLVAAKVSIGVRRAVKHPNPEMWE